MRVYPRDRRQEPPAGAQPGFRAYRRVLAELVLTGSTQAGWLFADLVHGAEASALASEIARDGGKAQRPRGDQCRRAGGCCPQLPATRWPPLVRLPSRCIVPCTRVRQGTRPCPGRAGLRQRPAARYSFPARVTPGAASSSPRFPALSHSVVSAQPPGVFTFARAWRGGFHLGTRSPGKPATGLSSSPSARAAPSPEVISPPPVRQVIWFSRSGNRDKRADRLPAAPNGVMVVQTEGKPPGK
jgi:hypothetical protein